VPAVERITLENGIRLYLLEDHMLPVFRASVVINGGSYLEPDGKIGLAQLVGTVLRTGGTEKWTGDQIDEALESVGGTVETSFGLLTGSAYVATLSEQSDLALEVLAEILQRPVFDTGKINLAKVQLRSAISRRNDDPFTIAQREFTKQVYGPTSVFARQMEYNTVNSVKRDDLMAFHKAIVVPKNIQLAVWGISPGMICWPRSKSTSGIGRPPDRSFPNPGRRVRLANEGVLCAENGCQPVQYPDRSYRRSDHRP